MRWETDYLFPFLCGLVIGLILFSLYVLVVLS